MNICIDVGNSTIGIGTFEDVRIEHWRNLIAVRILRFQPFPPGFPQILQEIFPGFPPGKGIREEVSD